MQLMLDLVSGYLLHERTIFAVGHSTILSEGRDNRAEIYHVVLVGSERSSILKGHNGIPFLCCECWNVHIL